MNPLQVVKHSIGSTNGHTITCTTLLKQSGNYWLVDIVLGIGVGKLYQVGYLETDDSFVPRKTYAMHEGLEALRDLVQLGGTDQPIAIRYQCAICGKVTAGRRIRTPWNKGAVLSDGSITYRYNTDWRYPRRHKVDGEICPGSFKEAIEIS